MVTFSTLTALRPMASPARASCSCRRFSGSTTTSEGSATTTRPKVFSSLRRACSTGRRRESSSATAPRRSTRGAGTRPISAGKARSWTSRPASMPSKAHRRWSWWAIAGAARSPGLPHVAWRSTQRSATTAARSSSSSARHPPARRCFTSAPKTRASPMADVDEITTTHPDVTVHVYQGAGHGFNCDQRADYHPEAAALARDRSLAHLARHIG